MGFLSTLRIHFLDYVLILICALIGGVPQVVISPGKMPFSVEDVEIQLPERDSRIPSANMFLYVLPPTIFFIVMSNIIEAFAYGTRVSWIKIHHGLVAWAGAVAIDLLFQGTMSIVSGQLRPSFLATCQPSPAVYTPGVDPVCLNDISDNMRRSFPCGHCSFSTGNYFYLSLYLMGKLKPWKYTGQMWKHLAVLIPLLGAVLISLTRIVDAKHGGFDVVVGIMIGLLSATYVYHVYHYNVVGPISGEIRPVEGEEVVVANGQKKGQAV